MSIATEVADCLSQTAAVGVGRPMSAVSDGAPMTGSDDGEMSRASLILFLLSSLRDREIDALTPVDRRLLQSQLERVQRLVGAKAVGEPRGAAAAMGSEAIRSKAAFLDDQHDARGRE